MDNKYNCLNIIQEALITADHVELAEGVSHDPIAINAVY
jgi:hypothetical protein